MARVNSMPLVHGSVSFSRFLVKTGKAFKLQDARKSLGRILKTRAFEPIDRRTDDERASGFVELENNDAVEFPVSSIFHAEHALFSFRVDTLRIPSAALKQEVSNWEKQFQAENDRAPSRKELADAKSNAKQLLRNKATVSTRAHDVSWNLKTGHMQIWAGSRKSVEEVQAAVESALSIELVPRVPGAMVDEDIDEALIGPTVELLGVDSKELSQ